MFWSCKMKQDNKKQDQSSDFQSDTTSTTTRFVTTTVLLAVMWSRSYGTFLVSLKIVMTEAVIVGCFFARWCFCILGCVPNLPQLVLLETFIDSDNSILICPKSYFALIKQCCLNLFLSSYSLVFPQTPFSHAGSNTFRLYLSEKQERIQKPPMTTNKDIIADTGALTHSCPHFCPFVLFALSIFALFIAVISFLFHIFSLRENYVCVSK